jgi:hypothetical protein
VKAPENGGPPPSITHFHEQVSIDGDLVIGTKFTDRARP